MKHEIIYGLIFLLIVTVLVGLVIQANNTVPPTSEWQHPRQSTNAIDPGVFYNQWKEGHQSLLSITIKGE